MTYLGRFPSRRALKRAAPARTEPPLPTKQEQEGKADTETHDTKNKQSNLRSRGYCPLLQLPAEIRHEIYRYLLPSGRKNYCFYTDCDRTIVGTRWHRRLDALPPERCSTAILRTNRTIYHEALSVLYSEHLFHFIGFNYLPVLDFIRRLSPEARDMVRRVRLTLLTDPRQRCEGDQPENYELFCKVVFDFLPYLNTLRADPWIWM